MRSNAWKNFFRQLGRIDTAFLVVFIFSLIIYILTCCRHLSWEHDGADGGDFAACAATLGIPHPTGYPLYVLVGWLFIKILPIGEIAFRLNIFSALNGALGAAFAALAIRHASDFIWKDADEKIKHLLVPMIAGFTIAFSYSYWSQALIVEVYTFNAFFLALITFQIALFLKSDNDTEKEKIFLRTALITGIGFGNHLSMLYPLIAGIITIAASGWIPRLKVFFIGVGLFILPLALYLYLPIRSRMNPFMDWGNPEDWAGFVWVLTGKQFKRLVFASIFAQILDRLYMRINLIQQFGYTGLLAAFLGIAHMLWIRNKKPFLFFLFITSIIVLNFIHIGNYLVIDPLSFMLPSFMMLGLFASIGLGWLVISANSHLKNVTGSMKKSVSDLALLISRSFAIAIPSILLIMNYGQVDLSKHNQNYDYVRRSFNNAVEGSIICEAYYGRSLSLLYYWYVEGLGKDKGITPIYFEQLTFKWGKKNFREHYPELGLTPDDNMANLTEVAWDFIERNYDKVPAIYFAHDFEAPKGYEWKAVDDLNMIVRIDKESEENDIEESD